MKILFVVVITISISWCLLKLPELSRTMQRRQPYTPTLSARKQRGRLICALEQAA
jgi:hypothetical protein